MHVALNNPFAPNAFNRSEETKSSLVKNYNFLEMTFDLMSDIYIYIYIYVCVCVCLQKIIYIYMLNRLVNFTFLLS